MPVQGVTVAMKCVFEGLHDGKDLVVVGRQSVVDRGRLKLVKNVGLGLLYALELEPEFNFIRVIERAHQFCDARHEHRRVAGGCLRIL
jgi:hypothetical protein